MKRDRKQNTLSEEQEQIVALKASLEEMKKESSHLSKAFQSSGKTNKKGKNSKKEGKVNKLKKVKG